jgi:hypothetical protein
VALLGYLYRMNLCKIFLSVGDSRACFCRPTTGNNKHTQNGITQ